MGCSGSRLGHGHAGVVLPPRLRPLFLLRLEEFRMRRRHVRPIKDSSSTNSKIILLHVQRDDDDENSSDSVGTKLYEEKQEEGEEHGKPKLEEVCEKINVKDHVKIKEESEFEDALTDAYNSNNDGDDDDDDEDDGRMIGHGDGEAFPASPSFRVYFKDVGEEKHNDLGEVKNNNAFNSRISGDDDDNEILSYKNKKVKKGRKRKSFKKVLPKGGQTAVKNLLTINLCYSTPSPSPSPHHHHRHRRNHSVT